MERVRHKVAARISPPAEIDKDFPVTGPWPQNMHLLARAKVLEKFEGQRERRWLLEDFWVSNHAQTSAQGQLRNSDTSRLSQRRFQP